MEYCKNAGFKNTLNKIVSIEKKFSVCTSICCSFSIFEILELDENDDFREDPGVLSDSSLDSILFNAVSTFGVETVCKSGCVTVSTLYKMRCVIFFVFYCLTCGASSFASCKIKTKLVNSYCLDGTLGMITLQFFAGNKGVS